METVTNLRLLRLRHGISLTELERLAGLCNQYISRAELGEVPATPRLEEQLDRAMEELIRLRTRRAQLLDEDYQKYKGRLLVPAEDADHEC